MFLFLVVLLIVLICVSEFCDILVSILIGLVSVFWNKDGLVVLWIRLSWWRVFL